MTFNLNEERELLSTERFTNTLPKSNERNNRTIRATVTAYNTVEWQTDNSPCIPASGNNICGRTDVVACPRSIALGTTVSILGKSYVCEDRLHPRYDARFDISFDKDIQGARDFGKKELTIKVYAKSRY
jgi:3D (Asp-Asp-Asp) domain-containing protein